MLVTATAKKVFSYIGLPVRDKEYFLTSLKKLKTQNWYKVRHWVDDISATSELFQKFRGRETQVVNWLKEIALNEKLNDNEEDLNYRVKAIYCLAMGFILSKFPEIRISLKKCLEDKNPKVIEAALNSLQITQTFTKLDEEIVPALLKYLGYPEKLVQIAAVDFLSLFGNKEVYEALLAKKEESKGDSKLTKAVNRAVDFVQDSYVPELCKDLALIAKLEPINKEAERKAVIEKYTKKLDESGTRRMLAEVVLLDSWDYNCRVQALYCLKAMSAPLFDTLVSALMRSSEY